MPFKTAQGSTYTDEQLHVAQQAYLICKSLGFWDKVITCVLCTMKVESSFWGPIPWGDQSNTRGAFQQKDDWVNPLFVRTPQDPRTSLTGGIFLFLQGGYARQKGLFNFDWVSGDIGRLCQQVQQSDRPDAYTKALPDVLEILAYVQAMPDTRSLSSTLRPMYRTSSTSSTWSV